MQNLTVFSNKKTRVPSISTQTAFNLPPLGSNRSPLRNAFLASYSYDSPRLINMSIIKGKSSQAQDEWLLESPGQIITR